VASPYFPRELPRIFAHHQAASVNDENQCSLHSFFPSCPLFFFFPPFFAASFRNDFHIFFRPPRTEHRHWALLLRNGLVLLVVRQGWSIGLLVSRAFTYMTNQSKLIIFFGSVLTTTQILRLLAENTLGWGALFCLSTVHLPHIAYLLTIHTTYRTLVRHVRAHHTL